MQSRFYPGRCMLCPRNTNPIPGDGPKPCQVMLIGEKPGPQEDRKGKVWIGDAGKELDLLYLRLAGLHRYVNCYVTNAIKCFRTADADDDQVLDCAEYHLRNEIHEVQPAVIVPMGAPALTLFPGLDLDHHHGIPFIREIFGHECIIMPTYNPAAGMHKERYMIPLRSDFQELHHILHGIIRVPEDRYPHPDYQLIDDSSQLQTILNKALNTTDEPQFRHETSPVLTLDTEFIEHNWYTKELYCISFSTRPGNGHCILRSNDQAVTILREWIQMHRPLAVFHHELVDVPMLRQVGIWLDRRPADTMRLAYHLQDVPQALKVLAYRLCGMVMEDYDDVVRPYYTENVLKYLTNVALSDYSRYRQYRRSALHKRAERIMRETLEGKHKDPGELWRNIPVEERKPAEADWGPCPKPSIAQVPIPHLVHYACQDSDATMRLLPLLKRRLIERRRSIPSEKY